MKFNQLLEIVGDEPIFETGLLLAGSVDPAHVRRQLSRWTQTGRLYQLRRGLYALAPPFQKVKPHPFLVANRLVQGSYVSLQSVLSYEGLIPDVVPVTTSVTTGRPGRWQTALGIYDFRHIKQDLFRGYRVLDLGEEQQGFVATAEKALLDLLYLHPASDNPDYVQELRLQNLERLDLSLLSQLADGAGSSKLRRAANLVAELAEIEAEEYEPL
jgi:predicted transcriptional regulator of viral defense system